jgi:hypothetical protein
LRVLGEPDFLATARAHFGEVATIEASNMSPKERQDYIDSHYSAFYPPGSATVKTDHTHGTVSISYPPISDQDFVRIAAECILREYFFESNLKGQAVSGFYDPKSNSIVVPVSYTATTLLHEYIHSLASDLWHSRVAGDMDEGVTEFLSRKAIIGTTILSRTGDELMRSDSYGKYEGIVEALVNNSGQTGIDMPLIQRAYMGDDHAISALQSAWVKYQQEYDGNYRGKVE